MEDTDTSQAAGKAKPSRKKRLWRLARVLIFSIILVAILLEVFIRAFDPFGVSHFSDMPRYFSELCEIVGPPCIIRHRPNTTLELRDFKITTNSLGFRDGELEESKPDGEYRLLFLGDSVVLGWGVEQEALFPCLAEKELNAVAGNQATYRCINTGHNQFDTTQEAALLHACGDRLKPDAVVLVYVNNDVNPTIKVWEGLLKMQSEAEGQSKGIFTRTKNWIVGMWRKVFRGTNDLLALCSHLWTMAKSRHDEETAPAGVDPEGWAASRDALLEIKAWCRAREIPLVVMNHTRPGEDGAPPEIPPLVPFLESEGIPCFPFHFTAEEQKLQLRHSVSDAHANRRGHQLLLEKLRPALEHLGLNTR
jgi:hypothetical protein